MRNNVTVLDVLVLYLVYPYTLAFIFAHKEDYARVRSLKEFLNNLKLLCGFNHQRIKH